METEALAQYCQLGVGANGQPLARAPGQFGWQVRDATGAGRPSLTTTQDGDPGIVPYNASRAHLRHLLGDGFRIARLVPIDEDGQVIDGAPVAQLLLEEERRAPDVSEHALEFCRTFISFIESKDMLINKISTSLVETNQNIHHDSAELVRATSTMINVVSGVERPELNTDDISRKVADKLRESEAANSTPSPWFVQLLNGEWGKSMLGVAREVAHGISVAHKAKK